jgi:hypothetical protein
MILISSFRPFDEDPTGEYVPNQLAAKASWEKVASRIIYFNKPEPRLDSPKTSFVPSVKFPPLIELIECAAMQTEWVAILNADIVLGPNFHVVEARLKMARGKCATSWRYNFDPKIGIQSGKRDDNGLDFFAATPEVWQHIYDFVDVRLHIGAGYWDTWLLSMFCTVFQSGFFNITIHRTIFHPRHEGRKYGPGVDHTQIAVLGDAQMTGCAP